MCRSTLSLKLALKGHRQQAYGLSPVWVGIWRTSMDLNLNTLGQYGHGNMEESFIGRRMSGSIMWRCSMLKRVPSEAPWCCLPCKAYIRKLTHFCYFYCCICWAITIFTKFNLDLNILFFHISTRKFGKNSFCWQVNDRLTVTKQQIKVRFFNHSGKNLFKQYNNASSTNRLTVQI